MKVIAEKPWAYVLFDDGKDWVLTYLVGGAVEIDVSLRLSEEEIERLKAEPLAIESLVADAKVNRDRYEKREIRPGVWPKRGQRLDVIGS